MTSLADLRAAGAFVPEAPTPVEITFRLNPDGDEFTALIHVRKMSVGDHERIEQMIQKLDAAQSEYERSYSALAISELVTLGDGTERIPFKDAYQLDNAIAKPMMAAINRLNHIGKEAGEAKK